MDEDLRWARELRAVEQDRALQPLRICQLCVRSLQVSGAGIAMVTAVGNRGVVCATDEVAARIEDLQLTLGVGPCVDAAVTGSPILVGDLLAPEDVEVDRWPAFMAGAATEGVRAVFAFPLRIGAINLGSMDLYRDRPGDLSAAELRAALMAANAAALALLNRGEDGDDAFADDVNSRGSYQLQVHQAAGMVQVQLGTSTANAYLMLRARAFSTGRSLADIAADVIERRLRFSAENQ